MILHNPVIKGNVSGLRLSPEATDPTTPVAGDIWYNGPAKVFRIAVTDDAGTGVDVKSFADAEALALELTSINDSISLLNGDVDTEGSVLYTVQNNAGGALTAHLDGDFADLEALVSLINADGNTAGSFRESIAAVIGTAPEALDTLQEISAALDDDADLAQTLRDLITSSITAAKSELRGTVDPAMDTMQEIVAAIDLMQGADTVSGSIAHSIKQVVDAQALVNTDVTDRLTDLEASEGAVESANLVRDEINARHFAVTTTVAATSHTIVHGLNSMDVVSTIWVERTDGTWWNDLVGTKNVDADTLLISGLAAAANVKVSVISTEDHAQVVSGN